MSPRAEPRTAWFDLTALRHPAWWAALVVLVLNDRLLKGHGVVPGWLTGKLSDFALVVVAPTLLAAMLPRALPWRRTLAFVSVLGPFVAMELSPAFSDALVAAMARLGLKTKLWPDPTDLVALACLPLTIHLVRLPARPPRRWSRGALERAGVILGAAACIADSELAPGPHAPYFVNTTGTRVHVSFSWVVKKLACDPPDVVAPLLGPDDLAAPRSFPLGPGEVAALDSIPAVGASPVGMCSTQSADSSGECAGVILEADGAQPVLVVARPRWMPATTNSSGCDGPVVPPDSQCRSKVELPVAPDPDAVTLRRVNGTLEFAVVASNPNLQLAPIDLGALAARPHDAQGCGAIAADVRALLAAPTCTTSSDCRGVRSPGGWASPDCNVAINVGAQGALQELLAKWRLACGSTESGSCGPPHPATCIEGHCVPACADVVIPACPQSCPAVIGRRSFVEGESCVPAENPNPREGWCRRGDGGCSCSPEGVVTCFALRPITPTCPLNSCLDEPGGGFIDLGPNRADAGSTDADAADAGLSDASDVDSD
jgi:hypothetical protein